MADDLVAYFEVLTPDQLWRVQRFEPHRLITAQDRLEAATTSLLAHELGHAWAAQWRVSKFGVAEETQADGIAGELAGSLCTRVELDHAFFHAAGCTSPVGLLYHRGSMSSPQVIFQYLIQEIERRRPHVAVALRAHRADLMIVGDVKVSDDHRIAALRRAGAATIGWALAEPWPVGPSFTQQRLRADLKLLHHAWELANDGVRIFLGRVEPDKFQLLAR